MNDIKLENIMNYIEDFKYKNITKMAKDLKMARTTLIYYVNELEKKQIIRKSWGNIKKNVQIQNEANTNKKMNLNINLKKNIAYKASKIIKPKDVIFIDSGSTTGLIAKIIKNMDITIYTNNIYFINLLGLENSSAKINIIPGNLYNKTLSIVGSKAIKEISSIIFDKCFIGINSKINNEYFTSNEEEALIKETAIQNSKETYLTFDKTKINAKGLKYKINIDKKVNELIS